MTNLAGNVPVLIEMGEIIINSSNPCLIDDCDLIIYPGFSKTIGEGSGTATISVRGYEESTSNPVQWPDLDVKLSESSNIEYDLFLMGLQPPVLSDRC